MEEFKKKILEMVMRNSEFEFEPEDI